MAIVEEIREVEIFGPSALVGTHGSHVGIYRILQSFEHTFVSGFDDAGHEAVLVSGPVGVGLLEHLHLLRHHANLRVGIVKDTLAGLQHLRRDGNQLVGTVGLQEEQVEVLQVPAVGEAVVLQLNLEVGVAVVALVQVGEVDVAQVLVASEGTGAHVVGLVVVIRADVEGQLQGTVVVVQEVVVGLVGEDVLYEVAVLLMLLLDGVVFVGKGVPCTVVVQRAAVLGYGLTIGEVLSQRLPRLAGQEVVLARRVDDDVELRAVNGAEDAVAAEDEVLGA